MTTQTEMSIPAVMPSEDDCAGLLADMWQRADIHTSYPASSSVVAELLRDGGGFDIDVPTLESWARSRQVGQVPILSGRFKWNSVNIALAASLLNATRRWLPLHPLHLAKMSPSEVAEGPG